MRRVGGTGAGAREQTRLPRRLPGVLLITGAALLMIMAPMAVANGVMKELPWFGGSAVFLAAAAHVWRRLGWHPVAWWFAVAGGLVAIIQAFDGLVLRLAGAGPAQLLPWVVLGSQLAMTAGGIAIAHLIGLFPDGRVQRPYERRVLRGLWTLLALPPLVLVGRPTVLLPTYHLLPDLPNPYYVSAFAPVGAIASAGVVLLQGVFTLGVVLLVLRYRRASEEPRRRIRWLLLPAVFAAGVAVLDMVTWRLFPAGAPGPVSEVVVSALWILVIASLPLAIAVALLRPDLLDVDLVLRKSLVYGFLWLVIAAAYVVAAAGLGVAAGQRFPVGVAITLTVVATLLFQPARRRLELYADRWVFGERTDPAQLVARLGATLEETFDLESLLPRMADTLQDGLGLRWARVRLESDEPAAGEQPVLVVPITLGEETLGVVECGPKASGGITPGDEAVVGTLARQAALAVRNVRLTAELADRAEQLAASRARLVRAQDAERRRIERNIHDGVQQDLVALISHVGRLRNELARDPSSAQSSLDELQVGIRQVIGDLRELAHGIHPTLLSDRGLLEAVEALAARSPVPVTVRADPMLRGLRFAEEVEGAGYFTVAEALANILKHADAGKAQISLARTNGSLAIEISDDGGGFAAEEVTGGGLVNLAERLAALDGRLEVFTGPGGGTTVRALLAAAEAPGA